MELPEDKYEWAINAVGNVMLAAERFYVDVPNKAAFDGEFLTIHYDWFRRIKVEVPIHIKQYLISQPTLLLVTFTASQDVHEQDIPLEVAR